MPKALNCLLSSWLLVLGGLFVSCGGSDVGSASVLRLGNGTEPETLDPHLMTGHPEFKVAWALFEGLTTLDPATLDVRPGVAESWEVSEDGLLYRFRLRPDARWSNGDPVTARDFVFAWKRMLTPGLAAPYADFLFPIDSAQAYNNGEIQDFGEVGVRAVEDLILEVRLIRPTPHFLFVQAMPFYFPVHEKSLLEFGAIDQRDTRWTRPGNLVSNGAFQLAERAPDRFLRVEKNPHYPGRDAVRLKGVEFYPIDSAQTEERAFRTGKLHQTNSLAPNKIDVYRRENPDLLRIHPLYGTYFYRFNTTRPPLDDARVRRALAMAIDRRDIVEHVTRGGQEPTGSFVPPGVGYTPADPIPRDIEEARGLLAEAGFPNGEGFPRLSLLYNTSESHRSVAEAVQFMWKTHLGVEIELMNQDWKVYLNTVAQLDYEIARGSWIGDYVDPQNFLEILASDSPHNRCGYSNAEYDSLIAQATRFRGREERYALLRRAEEILLADAPVAPIYTYASIFLQAPEVKGWGDNLMDYPSYRQAWIEESSQ
ncbi:peptide ABC transporter substrate-binding protein [bacterium]|nr:peptide ABC transporter substrate-binding protein [bacterium]